MTEKNDIEEIFSVLSKSVVEHGDKIFSNLVGLLMYTITKFEEPKRGFAMAFLTMHLSRLQECNYDFEEHRRKTVENTLEALKFADDLSNGPH
jgi:hypothetical protein